MIRLRNVTTAFLRYGDDFLLSKRSETRRIAPGYWYGVGGHLEPAELNDPYAACLREIGEETGLQAADLAELSLRYIVVRHSQSEIVLNYFYFGKALKPEVQASDEGELYWIPAGQVLDRLMAEPIRLTLDHYLAAPGQASDVWLGAVVDSPQGARITWTALTQWDSMI